MRIVALIILTAFVAGCTQTVPRSDVEVRRYRVEWEKLDAQIFRLDGLEVRGVVLTPTQFPLETGMTRLLRGDFIGFMEGLNLSFHPSRIPSGVLQDLFDAGYLPAYVKIHNAKTPPLPFDPMRLGVKVDDSLRLSPVPPGQLPSAFKKIDWKRMAKGFVVGVAMVTVVAGIVILLMAVTKGKVSVPGNISNPGTLGKSGGSGGGRGAGGARGSWIYQWSADAPPPTGGLLLQETLSSGESREGIVFFRYRGGASDWTTARVTTNR